MQRRQWLKLMGAASLAPLLSNCSQPTTLQKFTSQIPIFGTLVDIQIYSDSPEKANMAMRGIDERFQRFHKEWHAWEKGGIVSKINQAIAQESSITLAPSIIEFIKKSQRLCEKSQGLFDPGIGELIAIWGFHSDSWNGQPPNPDDIEHWLAHQPSILDLILQNTLLRSDNPMVQLDFGGNAKGLALDIAMDILIQHQIEHAIVSIGGDMKTLGLKPVGTAQQFWNVGIQNPQAPETAVASLEIHANESVVTSGTYQRYFEWQGKRYSHILNPNTGYPAEGFASVTVIHPDATTADSAATALLIAGEKQWQEIAQSMEISYVFAINYEGKFFQSKSMAQRLKLI